MWLGGCAVGQKQSAGGRRIRGLATPAEWRVATIEGAMICTCGPVLASADSGKRELKGERLKCQESERERER
jgi:hypothetical protein